LALATVGVQSSSTWLATPAKRVREETSFWSSGLMLPRFLGHLITREAV